MDVAQTLTTNPLRGADPMETGVPAAPAATTVSAPVPPVLRPLPGVNAGTPADPVPEVAMSSSQVMHGGHSSQKRDRAYEEAPTTAGSNKNILDMTTTATGANIGATIGTIKTTAIPVLPSTDTYSLASSSHSTASQEQHSSTKHNKNKDQVEHERKERVVAYVLHQGKIIKMSRRLRTRLEYAVLKIRRGWSKYTLQEVESLLEAPSNLSLHSSSSQGPKRARSTLSPATTSLRQSERKRTRKAYPDYEQHSELISKSGGTRKQRANSPPSIITPVSPSGAGAVNGGYIRRTRPSFSLFKDSELFLPAKSLMDIATSSPAISPATSPRPQHSQVLNHNQSSYGHVTAGPLYQDMPTRNMRDIIEHQSKGEAHNNDDGDVEDEGEDEEEGEIEGPPDTQAARTILMLASSPTRPPPRTLNTQFRASAPSSPILQHAQVAPLFSLPASHPFATTGSGTTNSIGTSGGSGGFGLLAASYSPMTSSPLVQFQTTAASTPSPDKSPSISNSTTAIERDMESAGMDHSDGDNNPFLSRKKVAKTASSSSSSPSSSLTASGFLQAKDSARHGHEPTSPSPLSVSFSSTEPLLVDFWDPTRVGLMDFRDGDMLGPLDLQHDMDMVPIHDALLSTPSPPLSSLTAQHGPQNQQQLLPLGIRTPPPSGGVGVGVSGKSILQESIMARRRGSGLAGGSPGMDLVTMFFTNVDPSSRHGDPSMAPPPGTASAMGDNADP